jgi:hypothetical protein
VFVQYTGFIRITGADAKIIFKSNIYGSAPKRVRASNHTFTVAIPAANSYPHSGAVAALRLLA